MDSSFVESLTNNLSEQYPDLVRAIGEFNARTEVELHLAGLVLQSTLDVTDAYEIGARVFYGRDRA